MIEELVTLSRSMHTEVCGNSGGLEIIIETALQTYLGKMRLIGADIQPRKIRAGDTLKITYEIESAFDIPFGVWLGASFRDKKGKLYHNTKQDKQEWIKSDVHKYSRELTVSSDAPLGTYGVGTNLWFGVAGDSNQSKRLQANSPISIEIA